MSVSTSIRSRLAALCSVAGLALAGGLAAGSAQAAFLQCSNGIGDSSATFALDSATASSCFAGDDTSQINHSFSLFGMTGWKLTHKNDGPVGDQAAFFTTAPTNGTRSGTWAVENFNGLSEVVITLKAGNSFGAFLIDTSSFSGRWESSGDLSHAAIYFNGAPPPPPPQPVPLPAAAWLLLAGMGGLGAVARRRKTSRA